LKNLPELKYLGTTVWSRIEVHDKITRKISLANASKIPLSKISVYKKFHMAWLGYIMENDRRQLKLTDQIYKSYTL